MTVRPTFTRVFSMPNRDTLSVPAMHEWAVKWLDGRSDTVDPFARNCLIATYRNDLNPDTTAQYHMDAVDFCRHLGEQGVRCEGAIFDPPYSPRQIKECYEIVGRQVGAKETQNAALYKRVRDALDDIVLPGGIVLSFGWNSTGMGVSRGYTIEDLLLVHHGGAHNDTICIAERKSETLAKP